MRPDPDGFPLRHGDGLRIWLADLILGKRLVQQFVTYVYEQGQRSTAADHASTSPE
jgi:hypothetical protein